MTLKEILHTISEEKKSGLIAIDDWKWTEVDHLATMGFGFNSDYYMKTDKPPFITIYKKKEKDPNTNKTIEYFYLEEENKPQKKFRLFNDLIDFFDTYEQPEIDKNSE